MKTTLIALVAIVVAAPAIAEDDQRSGERGKHRMPPPVALEACAASVEGDPCNFEGRHGDTIEGNCFQFEESALACKPDHPPQRQLERVPEADSA